MQFAIGMTILECSFIKHSHSPLGVKIHHTVAITTWYIVVITKIIISFHFMINITRRLCQAKLLLWTSFEKIMSKRRCLDVFRCPHIRTNIQVSRSSMDGQFVQWTVTIMAERTALADSRSYNKAHNHPTTKNIYFIHWTHSLEYKFQNCNCDSFIFICKSGDTIEVYNAPCVT